MKFEHENENPRPDFSNICLTEELFFKLIESVGNENIMDLQQALDELDKIDENTKSLADHIRTFIEPLNVKEIQSILEDVDFE